MRRRWKVLIGIALALAALLAINAIVVDHQTKVVAATVEGGRILSLPGGDIQVVEVGPRNAARRGAPIVLIHCYACSLHWWDRLTPLLAARHRVVRLDLLGFGGSAKPSSGYSIEQQAQLVAGALSELNVRGAVVVGHSMGAEVAVSLAQQASQLVDRVVDISDAPDTSFGNLPFLARLAYAPVLGEAAWRISPDFVVRDQYARAFAPGFDMADGFDDPNQVIDDFRAMTYSSYKEASEASDDFVDDEPLDERMRAAAVPLMVIFGAEDQLWDDPTAAAEAFRDVPGVRISMIEEAGHSPNIERPERTARLILDFAASAR
jgi:pimeloyl-ACP methyl ester carboxylesterase